MDGLEKVIEYIRADTNNICSQIAKKSFDECERIKSEYSRREQEDYWKEINAGSKAAEVRMDSLLNLANAEAQKLVKAMQNEMLDQAFDVAAMKLNELSEDDYAILLRKLNAPSGTNAHDLVSGYKESLSGEVLSELFN